MPIRAEDSMRRIVVELFGGEAVPSVIQTLDAAISSDLVLGLDTFTAHCGILRRTPAVVIPSLIANRHPDAHLKERNSDKWAELSQVLSVTYGMDPSL